MRRIVMFLGCIFVIEVLMVLPGFGQEKDASGSQYVEVARYYPDRDAAQDLADALAEAKRTNKNVLVLVGGRWCEWCRTLEKFYAENPELVRFRTDHYVQVKINYGSKQKNEQVLANFPAIPGYPHFFVLDGSGALLHSQGTEELELDKSYDLLKFKAFLEKWTKQPAGAAQETHSQDTAQPSECPKSK
ncbi:thioredoxin family protein [bacterium]|nr:thioredoxin family protein [bacterium]